MKPPFEKWDLSQVARDLGAALNRHQSAAEARSSGGR
jgi:hypothetical protein